MTVTQADFTAAMLDAALPVPEGLIDSTGHPAGRRFNVYRNNVAVSLTEALKTAFPVITKLLGEANMDGLARIYLAAHPPASPLMMFYGEAFPDFLAQMEQLSHLGYLPDVARLELAMRRAYHAADTEALAPEALGALPPEALMQAVLTLAPAVQLVRSPWPVHGIWRFNSEDGASKPEAGAEDVLITRPAYDPVFRLLPPGGAEWIAALAAGQTFGTAFEAAQSANPGFDLGANLTLLLQDGAITSLKEKE
jgi:hypothetical protein